MSTRRSFTWALPEWPQGTGCDPVYADSNSARPTKVCREFVQRPGRESLKLATPVRVRHSLPCFEIFQRVRLVAGPMVLNHQATVRFGYPLPKVCSRRSTGQDTRLRTERFASSNPAASASFRPCSADGQRGCFRSNRPGVRITPRSPDLRGGGRLDMHPAVYRDEAGSIPVCRARVMRLSSSDQDRRLYRWTRV